MAKRQQENCQKFDSLQKHCKQLEAKNNVLKNKLNKLETFQRKNNLKLVGISEIQGEMLEKKKEGVSIVYWPFNHSLSD